MSVKLTSDPPNDSWLGGQGTQRISGLSSEQSAQFSGVTKLKKLFGGHVWEQSREKLGYAVGSVQFEAKGMATYL